MECPYCDAELTDLSAYGYLGLHQSGEILGYIYKCPNSDFFENVKDAFDYLKNTGETLNSLGVTSIEEVSCGSFAFSGNFYTDKQGDLHEGYPC